MAVKIDDRKLYSTCCDAIADAWFEDIRRCPKCKESCDFEPEERRESIDPDNNLGRRFNDAVNEYTRYADASAVNARELAKDAVGLLLLILGWAAGLMLLLTFQN